MVDSDRWSDVNRQFGNRWRWLAVRRPLVTAVDGLAIADGGGGDSGDVEGSGTGGDGRWQ